MAAIASVSAPSTRDTRTSARDVAAVSGIPGMSPLVSEGDSRKALASLLAAQSAFQQSTSGEQQEQPQESPDNSRSSSSFVSTLLNGLSSFVAQLLGQQAAPLPVSNGTGGTGKAVTAYQHVIDLTTAFVPFVDLSMPELMTSGWHVDMIV